MVIDYDKEEILKSEILRKYNNNILEAYRNIDQDNPDNFITRDRLSISILDNNNRGSSIISTTRDLINNIKSYIINNNSNINSIFMKAININSYGQHTNQYREVINL
jgi:hypothetical protein